MRPTVRKAIGESTSKRSALGLSESIVEEGSLDLETPIARSACGAMTARGQTTTQIACHRMQGGPGRVREKR